MPLNLDILRKFSARSDRVKSVEFHPREPWVLTSLYSGHISIWNYETETIVKTLEISQSPIRCARFIPSKQWVVCGGDDNCIHVYNYNTTERIAVFQAHHDFIRCIAVHPTLPLILSCSDDMSIRLWNYSKGSFECQRTFEGHSHYVMQVEFHPKDDNTFASASLDATVKIWNLNAANPNFTLSGHSAGVNCLCYMANGEKPYLVSGGDDKEVRVWDYSTKQTVAVLTGHHNNLSGVATHSSLPLIFSASEDGSLKIWNSNNFKLEENLMYSMGRAWAVAASADNNRVAIGYEEGVHLIEVGKDEPTISMDTAGKLLWTKNNEILSARIKGQDLAAFAVQDGDTLPIVGKEALVCENYPSYLKHSANGRNVAVCGGGEFVIYTALTLVTQYHGPAQDFAWGIENGVFAAKEHGDKVSIYHKFAPALTIRVKGADALFGGTLLCAKTPEYVDFYDWNTGTALCRLEVNVKDVVWNASGTHVALIGPTSTHILAYNGTLVNAMLARNDVPEDGISDAFEPVGEIEEPIRSGCFAVNAFVYSSQANKIAYYIGEECLTLGFSDKPLFCLGYIAKDERVYLASSKSEINSFVLPQAVLSFLSAVLVKDLTLAKQQVSLIPQSYYTKLAHFLETRNELAFALEIAPNADQKFDLAIKCNNYDVALDNAYELNTYDTWCNLGDLALKQGILPLAQLCFTQAHDYSSLLLLYSSMNHKEGLQYLEAACKEQNSNISLTASMLLGNVTHACDILQNNDNHALAVLLSRTYAPKLLPSAVKKWKSVLDNVNVVQNIADPIAQPHLFPWYEQACQAQVIDYNTFETEQKEEILTQNMKNNSHLTSPVAAIPVATPMFTQPVQKVVPPVQQQQQQQQPTPITSPVTQQQQQPTPITSPVTQQQQQPTHIASPVQAITSPHVTTPVIMGSPATPHSSPVVTSPAFNSPVNTFQPPVFSPQQQQQQQQQPPSMVSPPIVPTPVKPIHNTIPSKLTPMQPLQSPNLTKFTPLAPPPINKFTPTPLPTLTPISALPKALPTLAPLPKALPINPLQKPAEK